MDDFEQIEQGQADALFTRQQSPAVGCGIHIFRHKLRLVELVGQHHVWRQALGHKPIPALVTALDKVGEGQAMVFQAGDRVLDQHLVPEDQLAGVAGCARALKSDHGRTPMLRSCKSGSLRQAAVDGGHRRPGVARGARQRRQPGMAGQMGQFRVKAQTDGLQSLQVSTHGEQQTPFVVDYPRTQRGLASCQLSLQAVEQPLLVRGQIAPAARRCKLPQRLPRNRRADATLRHQPGQGVLRNGQMRRAGVPQGVQQVGQRLAGALWRLRPRRRNPTLDKRYGWPGPRRRGAAKGQSLPPRRRPSNQVRVRVVVS